MTVSFHLDYAVEVINPANSVEWMYISIYSSLDEATKVADSMPGARVRTFTVATYKKVLDVASEPEVNIKDGDEDGSQDVEGSSPQANDSSDAHAGTVQPVDHSISLP